MPAHWSLDQGGGEYTLIHAYHASSTDLVRKCHTIKHMQHSTLLYGWVYQGLKENLAWAGLGRGVGRVNMP